MATSRINNILIKKQNEKWMKIILFLMTFKVSIAHDHIAVQRGAAALDVPIDA
jgi:hypothetical protein